MERQGWRAVTCQTPGLSKVSEVPVLHRKYCSSRFLLPRDILCPFRVYISARILKNEMASILNIHLLIVTALWKLPLRGEREAGEGSTGIHPVPRGTPVSFLFCQPGSLQGTGSTLKRDNLRRVSKCREAMRDSARTLGYQKSSPDHLWASTHRGVCFTRSGRGCSVDWWRATARPHFLFCADIP